MIADRVKKYYLDQGYNCAESVIHAANDEWELGLDDNTFKALGCFGGGCCCGNLCGALAGAIGAIGAKYIEKDMHSSLKAQELTKKMMQSFCDELGSEMCEDLSVNKTPEQRCFKVVESAAKVLDRIVEEK